MKRTGMTALFFVSGACGLVYEVVWMRRLSLFFGSDIYSSSITLAAFMGGLSLGAYLASRVVDRIRGHIVWYAVLELLIGVYALLFPTLLGLFDPLIAGAYGRWAVQASVDYHLVRTAVAFLTLLIPTALMGATLPLVLKAFTGRLEAFGETAGHFYAVNTLGALTGVVASTFVLIPNLGLNATTVVAIALNVGVAAVILFSRRAFGTDVPADEVHPPQNQTPDTVPERLRRVALSAIAISGFGSLALEVVWTRILIRSFSGTVYAFSLMLVTVLLGIALGSTLIAREIPSPARAARLLADLQAAIALSVAIAACLWFLIPSLYGAFVWGFTAINPALFGFGSLLGILVISVLFMLPAFALLGAAFPGALKVVHRGTALTGEAVGRVAFVNTLGCVAGALTAGFVLIPLIGSQASLLLLALVFFVNGWSVQRALEAGMPPRFRLLAAVLACGAVIGLLLPAQTVLNYNSQQGSAPRVIFHAEGMSAVVDVLETPSGVKVLSIDGNVEADTSLPQRRHFVLKAHLPMFALPAGQKSVLIVGLGLGITTSSLLKHADVAEIDVVELLPGIVKAQEHLHDVNGGVLDDPRLKLHVDDGRSFLKFSGKQYDLITADPIHPRISGVGVLYTKEYYELIRQHLKDSGVVLQWMPFYSMSPASLDVAIRTMAEVFPDTSVWYVPGHLMLLARRSGKTVFDTGSLERQFADPAIAADLSSIGIQGIPDFLNVEILSPDDLQRFLHRPGSPATLNTEDLPYLEYRTPFEFLKTPEENLAAILPFASHAGNRRFDY